MNRSTPSLRKRIALVATSTILSYLVAETVVSAAYASGILFPTTDGWFFEDSGRTVHFDPVRGFRLTSVPSRFGKVTKGIVEYIGVLRGNSAGFADRDDFGPERPDPDRLRIAVLGDSFSAGQYLRENWPDKLEDMTSGGLRPGVARIDFLNFSLDGVGLANWWSILTHVIDEEKYEIDALLIAVYDGDLERSFSFSEHRGYTRPMFERVRSWKPETWPKSSREARPYLRSLLDAYIVPGGRAFDDAMKGKWRVPRPWRPFLATWVTTRVSWRIARWWPPSPAGAGTGPRKDGALFEPEQAELIRQIDRTCRRRSLPVLVVRIPSRDNLLGKRSPPPDVRHFAGLLGATFVDGGEAFYGLTNAQVLTHFLPLDGHWNQRGSDLFAYFVLARLQEQCAFRLGSPSSGKGTDACFPCSR